MNKFLLNALIAVVVMMFFANVANAEALITPNEGSNAPNVEYMNGGIGQDEADDIRAHAGGYNLRIYLSEGVNGHAITEVPVTITDKRGNLKLDFTNCGPMLFLKLEKGTYKISAEHNGVTLVRKVVITQQRSMNIYLNWKNLATDAEDASYKTSPLND